MVDFCDIRVEKDNSKTQIDLLKIKKVGRHKGTYKSHGNKYKDIQQNQ
jgi:hypothetical protein